METISIGRVVAERQRIQAVISSAKTSLKYVRYYKNNVFIGKREQREWVQCELADIERNINGIQDILKEYEDLYLNDILNIRNDIRRLK